MRRLNTISSDRIDVSLIGQYGIRSKRSVFYYFPNVLVMCFVDIKIDIPMNKLVATTLEARYQLYDMRTQHPTDGYAALNQKVPRFSIFFGV